MIGGGLGVRGARTACEILTQARCHLDTVCTRSRVAGLVMRT